MIIVNHVTLDFISDCSRQKSSGYFTRSVFLEKMETKRGVKIRKTTIIVHFLEHLNRTLRILNEYRVPALEQVFDSDGSIANFKDWEKRIAETVASIQSQLDVHTNNWIEGLIDNPGVTSEIEFLKWQYFLDLDLAAETSDAESLIN
jgi:hypothetical protein